MWLEDQRTANPVRLELAPATLTVTDLDSAAATAAGFEFATRVNRSGSLRAAGRFSLAPVDIEAELQAAELELTPVVPYLRQAVAFDIAGGRLGLDGTLSCSLPAREPANIRWQGSLTLKGFGASDRHSREPFLKWEALALEDVALQLPHRQLSIARVTLDQPYARLVIRPDGTTDWHDHLSPPTAATAAPTAAPPAWPSVAIGSIQIVQGSGFLADLSLTPNFAATLRGLSGTVAGFSSTLRQPADVRLQGQVGGSAPVSITGSIDPWSEAIAADITLGFRNYDLIGISPYAAKFAGYAIRGGKLSLDLHYSLAEGQLAGENRIVMDQLTLGERIESPHAVDLPVALAVALLRDQHGRIDIDLPVRGDLRAPDFSAGRLVGQALKNLLTRVVTAPFRLLAGLAGSSMADLEQVWFAYGQAEPDEAQRDILAKLAKALQQRPELRLEIAGAADEVRDRAALAEQTLLRQLVERHRAALGSDQAGAPPPPASIEHLSLEEMQGAIIAAYQERFGKHPLVLFGLEPGAQQAADPNRLPPDIDPGVVMLAARRQLLDAIAIDDGRLRQLALDRAESIRTELTERGAVAAERIFLAQVELRPSEERAAGVAVRLGVLP
jgi:hypothetical protein